MKNELVIVQWEDSAQPTSNWQFKDDLKFSVVQIASVGWIVKKGKRITALAPNVGGLDGKVAAQVSGVIQIPTSAILSIVRLIERD